MRVTQSKSLRLEDISCIALHTRRVSPICNIACPGPVVSLGPRTWMPPSKKLHCVPLNNSQLIGYHPDINHYFLLSSPLCLLLFHFFHFIFLLPVVL